MKSKDWKLAMKETGFKYMDYVKSAKEEIDRKIGGWAYMVVAIDLEIRHQTGYFSISRVKVDMELLKASPNPGSVLCGEVLKLINKSFKEAGIEETGPENNKPD